MISISDATADDLDTFVSLGEQMHAESIESFPPIERERMQEYLASAISMPDVILIAFAESDGFAIGMITAVAGPYSFSSKLRAACDLLFVLPEHRGGFAAKRLVQRFMEWSDGVGADRDIIGVSTGIFPERTGRFFELMGFRPMCKMYQRDC